MKEERKIRRTALNRAVEEMRYDLEQHKMSVNFETRLMIFPLGTIEFEDGMTKVECKTHIRRAIKEIEYLKNLQHEAVANCLQKKLL